MPRTTEFDHSGHRRPFVAPAAVVAFGTLASMGDLPSPAFAESHKWIGAFAYSDSTGAFGYGANYNNSKDASQRAIKECQARAGATVTDCVMVQAFAHLCGALTVIEAP